MTIFILTVRIPILEPKVFTVQWQQICFARCPNAMKIVLNSELVLNETTKDMGTNNSNTTFWLGGEPHLKTMYRRFEVCVNGKVYKVFSGSFGYPTHLQN